MPTPHIEQAIMQLLRDHAGISPLVQGRIHPGHRPQNDTLPSIVVRKNEAGFDHDLDCAETHRMPSVIVEIFGSEYFVPATIAEHVYDLEDQDGIVTVMKPSGQVFGTLDIALINVEDEATDDDPPDDGSADWTDRRIIQLNCICERP